MFCEAGQELLTSGEGSAGCVRRGPRVNAGESLWRMVLPRLDLIPCRVPLLSCLAKLSPAAVDLQLLRSSVYAHAALHVATRSLCRGVWQHDAYGLCKPIALPIYQHNPGDDCQCLLQSLKISCMSMSLSAPDRSLSNVVCMICISTQPDRFCEITIAKH